MYKKLLALVNSFVYLRQGYFNRYYEGKILDVTPDTLTIQAYKEDGTEDAVWTLSLNTITEFMVGDRELDELKMRVCLAKSGSFDDLEAMGQPVFTGGDSEEDDDPPQDGSRHSLLL